MATFNIENAVIDRPLSFTFLNKDRKVIGGINEIENFSINTSTETKDKNAADGSLIMRFYTAKNVEVSAESSVVSFSLMGLQTGSGKKTGEDGAMTITAIKQYKASESPITLDPKPIDTAKISVVGLTSSGTPDVTLNYESAVEAGAGKFAVADDGDNVVITLPTDCAAQVQIVYDYETTEAIEIAQDSDKFPTTCEAIAKVLIYDPCDKESRRVMTIDFPSFQLSPDFDWTLDTESTQPFSGVAQVDFCGTEKRLYTVHVSGDEN